MESAIIYILLLCQRGFIQTDIAELICMHGTTTRIGGWQTPSSRGGPEDAALAGWPQEWKKYQLLFVWVSIWGQWISPPEIYRSSTGCMSDGPHLLQQLHARVKSKGGERINLRGFCCGQYNSMFLFCEDISETEACSHHAGNFRKMSELEARKLHQWQIKKEENNTRAKCWGKVGPKLIVASLRPETHPNLWWPSRLYTIVLTMHNEDDLCRIHTKAAGILDLFRNNYKQTKKRRQVKVSKVSLL